MGCRRQRRSHPPRDFAEAQVQRALSPGQVFCTGANYKKHVVGLIMGDPSMRTAEHENLSPEELKQRVEAMMDQRAKALPFVFLKLPSCVVGPRDDVILPRNVEKPDWELELGVVIGKRAHHVERGRSDGPCGRVRGGERRHRARAHLPPRRLGDRRRLALRQVLPDLPAVRADDRAEGTGRRIPTT